MRDDPEISVLERCTGRQLREMLALASSQTKTGRDWLLEVGDWEQMEHLLTEMRGGQSGAELLQAVCTPETPLDILIAAKTSAKLWTVSAGVEDRKAAATLLYHLAVASALAHHARNISSNDPASRLSLYKDLAADLADEDLAAVFEKAAARIPAGGV